jgi:head-tail adaptor
MPQLNRRIEIFQKVIDLSSGFPKERLIPLMTTYAEVRQLASERISTNMEHVEATERISVTIRYRELPDSLVVRIFDTDYYVTEINKGNFDKHYLILYADKIEGVE